MKSFEEKKTPFAVVVGSRGRNGESSPQATSLAGKIYANAIVPHPTPLSSHLNRAAPISCVRYATIRKPGIYTAGEISDNRAG